MQITLATAENFATVRVTVCLADRNQFIFNMGALPEPQYDQADLEQPSKQGSLAVP
jgi:hypothetical protein